MAGGKEAEHDSIVTPVIIDPIQRPIDAKTDSVSRHNSASLPESNFSSRRSSQSRAKVLPVLKSEDVKTSNIFFDEQ